MATPLTFDFAAATINTELRAEQCTLAVPYTGAISAELRRTIAAALAADVVGHGPQDLRAATVTIGEGELLVLVIGLPAAIRVHAPRLLDASRRAIDVGCAAELPTTRPGPPVS